MRRDLRILTILGMLGCLTPLAATRAFAQLCRPPSEVSGSPVVPPSGMSEPGAAPPADADSLSAPPSSDPDLLPWGNPSRANRSQGRARAVLGFCYYHPDFDGLQDAYDSREPHRFNSQWLVSAGMEFALCRQISILLSAQMDLPQSMSVALAHFSLLVKPFARAGAKVTPFLEVGASRYSFEDTDGRVLSNGGTTGYTVATGVCIPDAAGGGARVGLAYTKASKLSTITDWGKEASVDFSGPIVRFEYAIAL